MITYTIIPGLGLGDIAFGMHADEVKELVGIPEQIEQDEDELFQSIIWMYPEKALTLFFRTETDPMLIAMECSHPETLLYGEKIFKMNENMLTKLLKKNGLDEIEVEDEAWGERRISNEDMLIDFYFGDKGLATVNWSMVTEDDE